jgi:hypothetical protein
MNPGEEPKFIVFIGIMNTLFIGVLIGWRV